MQLLKQQQQQQFQLTNASSIHLNERLDLASLSNLLSTHSLGDLARVSVYTGDDGVGIVSDLAALFLSLEDDGLLARMSPREDDAHLAWLDDLWHLEGVAWCWWCGDIRYYFDTPRRCTCYGCWRLSLSVGVWLQAWPS